METEARESTEESLVSFSLRWPQSLVDRIDELARRDKRTRNNWLEVFVEKSLGTPDDTGRWGNFVAVGSAAFEEEVAKRDRSIRTVTAGQATTINTKDGTT